MIRKEKTRPQSIVDDLADEYRADALKRFSLVSQALAALYTAGDGVAIDDSEHLNEIKLHAHSIKGTSGTFGFSGLSVIAHTMDDYLNGQHSAGGPHFLENLERLNEVMTTIVSADEIVTEDIAQQMLSALHLDTGARDQENNKTSQAAALLIMEQGNMCETITRTLEILGLDVTFANDGVEAIELATVQHPDIILITLHSDRLSAPEVIQVFAEINATSAVPAIVLVPTIDDAAETSTNDVTTFLVGELPPGIHIIKQDEKLIRTLSDKLVELDIISP